MRGILHWKEKAAARRAAEKAARRREWGMKEMKSMKSLEFNEMKPLRWMGESEPDAPDPDTGQSRPTRDWGA